MVRQDRRGNRGDHEREKLIHRRHPGCTAGPDQLRPFLADDCEKVEIRRWQADDALGTQPQHVRRDGIIPSGGRPEPEKPLAANAYRPDMAAFQMASRLPFVIGTRARWTGLASSLPTRSSAASAAGG